MTNIRAIRQTNPRMKFHDFPIPAGSNAAWHGGAKSKSPQSSLFDFWISEDRLL